MREQGILAEVDGSGDRLAKMIRNGEQQRIPLVAVVGAKEVEDGTLSLRGRKGEDFGAIDVAAVISGIQTATKEASGFRMSTEVA